jgi:3-hydroxyacyl-CoA dehydrogenase
MTEPVSYLGQDGIAIVEIGNPPVNALSAPVRRGLIDAIARAGRDPEVRAIVMTASGRTWPAGADIREFDLPPTGPTLAEVCDTIEASAKPVVSALFGTALGGGLEIALAAQVRLAEAGTRLGLPEVTLGILPGAGGTQRLPRLIGAEAALALMLAGKPISAERAEALGIVDAVASEDVTGAAIRLAIAIAGGDAPLPDAEERRRRQSAAAWLDAVAKARAEPSDPHLPAPKKIIDCVEAALLLPEAEGHAFEAEALAELKATPQSKALRHAFLAERRAARQPELKGVAPLPVTHVGVVGGGLMGTGIAMAMLAAGLRVTLVEQSADTLAAALGRIASTHDRAVQKGRLSPEAREAEWDRIAGTTLLAELDSAELIVEAVVEDEKVKSRLFADLGRIAAPQAILATNTSYLDVNRIAESSGRPSSVLGLHFFSPAHVMKLVEIIPAAATDPAVIATGFALAKRLGKHAVRAGVCDGFIGNRILTAYRTAADFLLEDGASPYDIDKAMVAFGFPMGPYQVADMAGLDISWARRKRLAPTRDPAERYVTIGDLLCEIGRLGRKSGRGYYRYDGAEDGGSAKQDPEVLELIAQERERKGIVARPVSAGEIRGRLLAAMVNEGVRLLQEGMARCPSDIDVVMMAGYAYPRWRGGPMMTADEVGLLALRDQLRRFAREDERFWRHGPLWDELIKNGANFASLNRVIDET